MENNFNSPDQVILGNIKTGVVKAERSIPQMILLGIMAGAFIALGGATSNVAVHGIKDVGLSRALAGAIFPVGLMLIVFVGGELFTGNCLISMAVLDKKTSIGKMIRNLVIVYFSNLLGALIIDYLIFFSGELNYSGGGLGAYTIKVAIAKINISPVAGVTSGILCNMLVCLAILAAGAAKDITGKVWAIFFPIWAFVIGGFEHCVANMFYIPAGMLAASNPDYVAKAEELYGITAEQCASLTVAGSLNNFIPVTIGNIIGGAVFIGLMYFLIVVKTGKKAQ
ncbi:MAG: formate/nitrite transporter family protein [Lachnospiraceae bacterium]|nr:formate/nitrite transporter family protein [Lachnospiraceae bacterium]MDD7147834.1 formate/nitrite transporter family protein [Lachnospiraceae bacterium]MDY4069450.1 formate/nitrite transporter family protein [Lachnospiraceae bacterium]